MRRIHTLDIEVDWNRIEQPNFKLVIQKGSSPIQMIGCYDLFKNKFLSFFYHKEVNIKSDNSKLKKILSKRFNSKLFNVLDGYYTSPESEITYPCRYIYFNNEKTMIKSYLKFIEDTNPDIWHGFNIEDFDLVYIINRCKTLLINYGKLSPIGEAYISYGRAVIRGSIIYDLIKDYAKWQGTHRHANSLKKLAESHLISKTGKKITKTSDSILNENWYTNKEEWNKFIEYCLVDVELCILLEKELGLIEINNQMEKFSGVNPLFVRYASNMIESLFNFLKSIYEKEILNNNYKIAFDTSVGQTLEKSSAGALVLDNKQGLIYTGLLLIFDLSKMYPEIIKSLNISIETLKLVIDKTKKKDYFHCIANDVYYQKEPIGFIPFCFSFLFEIRKRIEIERDKYPYGSKKYIEIGAKRQVVKDSINAVTGQFDYYKSIIVKPICANSYRLTGQMELLATKEYALLFGENVDLSVDVIYGDTDSVLVHLLDVNDVEDAKQIGKEICKWIQTAYDKLAKEMNIDEHRFSVGLEAILDVYLSIGKKKKYFGNLVWIDGKYIEEGKGLYIKGFETRRSDSSELTDHVQKEIFGLICKTKKLGLTKVKKQIIGKIRNDYMNEFSEDNILEIGIPKGIHKSLDKWDPKTKKGYKVTNPWREGCLYANKYLNGNFGVGSKPKLIYIKEVRQGKLNLPHTNALCVEEGMTIPEGYFIIDKDKMIQKTVLDKLKKILTIIGIDETEILEGFKQKSVLDYIKSKTIEMKSNIKIDLGKLLKESNSKLIEHRKELNLSEEIKEIELTK